MKQKNTTNTTQIKKVMKVSKKIMQETIRRNGGIVANTAISLGWGSDRSKVYRYIKKYKLEEELDNARETLLDIAECSLINAVIKGDLRAVMFILRTRGKNRGYSERQEIELPDITGKIVIYKPSVKNE